MKILRFLLVICCMFTSVTAQADFEFPSAFYPTGPHPRLWLTQERLTAFQQARQSNTPEWQEFEQACNDLMDSDPGNDPWPVADAPQTATAPLALMYILTGDSRYADRALHFMDITPDSIVGMGNPDHQNFQNFGLAYDWLYNYPGMTEAEKTAYQDKMIRISNSFWENYNDDAHASGTDTDANILSGMIHLVLGAALYGDRPGAVTLLDRGWRGWVRGFGATSLANRQFMLKGMGGVYFTGFAYFMSTDSLGYGGYWQTLKTACNYDPAVQEPGLVPFWANTILSLIQLTEPGRQAIYPTGAWENPNTTATQTWIRRFIDIAAYFADQVGDHGNAALGRGYVNHIDPGYYSGWFDEFFFATPGATAENPFTAGLPLVRFADEPDFLLFRDSWETTARWGLFAGDGSIPADHQPTDQGHFALWRHNDYLTRGARNYDAMEHGDFYNTLSIENNCTGSNGSCSGTSLFRSQAGASIPRHRVGQGNPLFGYAMMQGDGQWNDPDDAWQPVQNVRTYRRHFFWANDYAIIFDRLRANRSIWSRYRLRALTEPVIVGDTVSQLSENGEHKLLQRTLEPAGAAPYKVDERDLWQGVPDWVVDLDERRWQSVIDLPVGDTVNVLNVIQMGPATMTGFDPLEHISDTENSGVRIGDWTVVFASREQLRSAVSYVVHNPAVPARHLVADLEQGFYHLTINTTPVRDVTVRDGDNTALFTVNSTASAQTVALQPYQPAMDLPASRWLQVALPADPGSSNRVADIFANIDGTYSQDWVVYSYTPGAGYHQLAEDEAMYQGVGYWIIQLGPQNVQIPMPATSVPTPLLPTESCPFASGCYQIPLAIQANAIAWNMVGHPFTQPIPLDQCRVVTATGQCSDNDGCTLDEANAAGIVSNQFWHYNGTSYEQVTTAGSLQPWAGYWVATRNQADGLAPRLAVPLP